MPDDNTVFYCLECGAFHRKGNCLYDRPAVELDWKLCDGCGIRLLESVWVCRDCDDHLCTDCAEKEHQCQV